MCPLTVCDTRQNFEKFKLVKIFETNIVFLKVLLRKLKEGYSPVVAICGQQRDGKSFLGIWLSYIVINLWDKIYDPVKHTFYDPIKTMKDLEFLSQSVIMIDEASDILNSVEWYNKQQQALKSMINTAGFKNNLYIIISPFFSSVAKHFRIHADFILKAQGRGNFKAWRFVKRYNAYDHKKAVFPVFLGKVHVPFNAVPANIWKTYEEFSFNEKEKIRVKRIKDIEKKETLDTMKNDLLSRLLYVKAESDKGLVKK